MQVRASSQRRRLPGLLLAAAALSAAGASRAQVFPSEPIKIVVGFPAGTTTDAIARIAAEHLRAKLGQPVIVINKPGANGAIGASDVARAPADGHTLLATNSSSMTVNPHLYRKLGYQLGDFAAITPITSAPLILTINPTNERTASIRSVSDFVAFMRANPGKLSYAAAGPGNITGLTFRIFNNHTGTTAHEVVYKSAVASQLAVLSREVDAFIDTPLAVPHVKAGKLSALAVTSPTRWRDLPDVPTLKEAGFPKIEVTFWLALFAPAATPQPVLDKLYAALASLRDEPGLAKQLLQHGDVDLSSPKDFGERIRAESAMWAEIIRRENLQLD